MTHRTFGGERACRFCGIFCSGRSCARQELFDDFRFAAIDQDMHVCVECAKPLQVIEGAKFIHKFIGADS